MHTKHNQLNVRKSRTSNKMMLFKFILNVWEDEIVSTLSELHGARWPGFDGEEMVKAMLFSQVAAK